MDLLYKSFSIFLISNEAAGKGRVHIKGFLWELAIKLSSEVARRPSLVCAFGDKVWVYLFLSGLVLWAKTKCHWVNSLNTDLGEWLGKRCGIYGGNFWDRHLATLFGHLYFYVLCGSYYLAPLHRLRNWGLWGLRDFSPSRTACEWHSQESNLHWSVSKV